MKTLALSLYAAAAAVALTSTLHSQAPAPVQPRTPLQAVQLIKQQNADLLQKQEATFLKLEEVAKDAAQMKVLAKRS